ncbi:MAG: homocysteine S-methyltransferase family protein [Polyangiaceae bacterium]|nr:homocysteine S-methyltransferase family protein [Polyangiaceae bacterium]
MSYLQLRHRLYEGRPLVLDADVGASLRALGEELDAPGALGAVLHRSPEVVEQHHQRELFSKVDILSALTADTTPRALAEAAMEHRAARLTGDAIDLALDATAQATRPAAVAGVLGSEMVTATARIRFEDETIEHAARIAVQGAELFIVRGMGSRLDLVFSVAAASAHELPVWAVIDMPTISEGDLLGLLQRLEDAGAEAVLFEVESVDHGLEYLQAFQDYEGELVAGALLSAAPDALRGFPSEFYTSWVERAVELTDRGARIIGGGSGTTEEHTRALARRLGVIHPSFYPQSLQELRVDSDLDKKS